MSRQPAKATKISPAEPTAPAPSIKTKPAKKVEIKPAPSAPKTIPRSEHTLSRKKVSPNALKVMHRLIRHGHRAYLVGGCVRDILLDRPPKDFDVVTDARPEQVRSLFGNSRLIGRRFRLVHVFFRGGEIIEVSTFRKEAPFDPDGDDDGPHEENTYGTPAEDAFRRDLTINGLFYDPQTFAIYDYIGGIDDLRNKTIRIIGEPRMRLKEDPARMFRVVRHAAGTGFAIEKQTMAAIHELAGEITKTNASRLRDEFLRELTEGRSARSVELMIDTGLLVHILPEMAELDAPTADGSPAPGRRHLLANLAALDRAIDRKKPIALPVVLAAFVSPLVARQNFASQAPDPHLRYSWLQQTTRNYVKPILHRIGIGKADAEAAALIILGRQAIAQALARGSHLPKSLQRKSYFPLSLLLYQIETHDQGQPLPRAMAAAQGRQMYPGDAASGPRKPRRRGGRRRKPTDRHASKPSPSDAPEQTTDATARPENADLKFSSTPETSGSSSGSPAQ
ncbi:MAG TPA: poly(A) polymerase [bacterium]|nr:poly(A) polymerase [bacterium]